MSDRGAAAVDGFRQIFQRDLKLFTRLNPRLNLLFDRSRLRISQQIPNQHLHADGAAPQIPKKQQTIVVEFGAVAVGQNLAVDRYRSQGFTQVMARRMCKLLQIPVCMSQLLLVVPHFILAVPGA